MRARLHGGWCGAGWTVEGGANGSTHIGEPHQRPSVEATAYRGKGEIVRQPGSNADFRDLLEHDSERLGIRCERVDVFGFKCEHRPLPS
jgi:hypothetical protein